MSDSTSPLEPERDSTGKAWPPRGSSPQQIAEHYFYDVMAAEDENMGCQTESTPRARLMAGYCDPLDEPTTRKEPRFPRAKPTTRRKPWAVWLLLMDGSGWEYSSHAGIVDAWMTAKALAGQRDIGRVWIAHIDHPAHIPTGH